MSDPELQRYHSEMLREQDEAVLRMLRAWKVNLQTGVTGVLETEHQGPPQGHTHDLADITTDLATQAELDAEAAARIAADAAHVAAGDPHTGYQKESEKGQASGYASLDGSTKVPIAQLPNASETAKGIVELAANNEAAVGLAVQADDDRLSNARTPTSHGSTHISSGSDPIPIATTTTRGTVELATSGENAANVVVQGNDARLSDARTPTTHASTHLSNGSDPIAAATTTVRGTVELATDGESAAGLAVQANDGRLSNSRAPTDHNHTGAGDGGDLTGALVSNYLEYTNSSDPASPAAGKQRIFASTDGNMYVKTSSGNVQILNIDQFVDLLDVPSNYTGHANKLVAVNAAATALEFIAGLQNDTQHGTRSGGTQHSEATGGAAGFLSAAGFTKLGLLLPDIGARVYNSADISINNNTTTALTFNSERWDTDTIHSTVTNTGRLTATTAGKYDINGHVRFAANGTGQRIVQIRLNGTTNIASMRIAPHPTAVTDISISATYIFAATDYVELTVLQDSGGALNITAVGNFSPEFSMQRCV